MRIHRISLRDFRGVKSADVEFALDGITIVQGPNEVGKSSLADALDMLLTDPDSSNKSRVKAAKPVNRDVGPWVQADIETGPYRMTYTKRWVKGTVTELTVHAPVAEQMSGRAAHDRVTAILGETMDVALFGALRHLQGIPLGQADLGDSESLTRALNAAAGAGTDAAESGGALIDAIEAERLIWGTPTGDPNRAMKDLRATADETDAQWEQAKVGLREVDARVEAHRRLAVDIEQNEARESELRDSVVRIDAELQTLIASETALAEMELAAEKALGSGRDAEVTAAARRALIATVEVAGAKVTQLREEGERVAARQHQSLAHRTDAAAHLIAAIGARGHADDAFAVAADDAQHQHDVFDLRSLRDRAQVVAGAEQQIATAEIFLGSCTINDDLLDRIEHAVVADAGARGRLQGAGARLRVTAEASIRVEGGGETHDLNGGEQVDVALGAGEDLLLVGLARVSVEGAGDAALADAARTHQALGALLRQAGVPEGGDASVARTRDRQRREHEARSAAAHEARSVALKDLTPDEMGDKIARAEARVVEYRAARGTDTPKPTDAKTAIAARALAEDARDGALRNEDAARQAHTRADETVRELEGDARERSGRREAVAERLASARDDLEAARAARPDTEVDDAVLEAGSAAAAATAALEAQRDALADADAESTRIRRTNAREAVDRLVRERTDMQMDAARREGEIARSGDEGLADCEALARERAEDAAAKRDVAEGRAAAANLLARTMERHRDVARRSYVAPFRAAVERFGRLVFGAGVQVEVDHATLQVVSRTQHGVTVPADALSGGAREQLAVIGRLAAASLVAPGADGGAPVIFDDALGYSDPSRLEGLGAALAEAAKGCQVIVLTCTPDRYASIGSARVVRLEPSMAEE